MNREQLDKLQHPVAHPVDHVGAAQLADRTPRTLLYGYTCERNSFHVYLDEDRYIHRVIYDYDKLVIAHDYALELPAELCVPDKRIYAEHSDYEFCLVLHHMGLHLPFTTFNEVKAVGPLWRGARFEALSSVSPETFVVPAFALTWDELDVENDAYLPTSTCEAGLRRALAAIAASLAGSLRAAVLRGDEESAARWLANLPEGVEQVVAAEVRASGSPFGNHYRMPEHVKGMLLERAKQAIQDKRSKR